MIKHFYLAFSDDQGISEDDIRYLLMMGREAKKQTGQHQTGDGYASGNDDRDTTISWVHTDKGYDILQHFIASANEICGWKYDVEQIEGIQIAEYTQGQFYNWHIDGDSDHCSARQLVAPDKPGELLLNETKNEKLEGLVRKLSVIIQLSDPDDYEGGDLYLSRPSKDGKIDIYGETIPQFRQKGSVIVFPSYVRHKVEPVTEGIRYSATAWICGPPFK